MTIKYPKPKAILFDWDNTLIDTMPTLYKAFLALKQHFDLPDYTIEEYKAMTGRSLRETFPALFKNREQEAKDIFLSAYQENHIKMLNPFDGAKELLEYSFKNIGKLGIVSNKTNYILCDEIKHLGWEKYFACVVGAGDAAKDKPEPDPAFLAFEQAKIATKNNTPLDTVWFVGDSEADIQCAKGSGCLPIFVSKVQHLDKSVLTVKNCKELLETLDFYK